MQLVDQDLLDGALIIFVNAIKFRKDGFLKEFSVNMSSILVVVETEKHVLQFPNLPTV